MCIRDRGLQDAMEHGVLDGYPMVGLKATLVAGSYHDVDSVSYTHLDVYKRQYKD